MRCNNTTLSVHDVVQKVLTQSHSMEYANECALQDKNVLQWIIMHVI